MPDANRAWPRDEGYLRSFQRSLRGVRGVLGVSGGNGLRGVRGLRRVRSVRDDRVPVGVELGVPVRVAHGVRVVGHDPALGDGLEAGLGIALAGPAPFARIEK